MTNTLLKLHDYGQSLWYDNIARDLLKSGAIQDLIDDGVLGMTSNPSIFNKAITQGNEYDNQLRELAHAGKTTKEIYEALAITDIQQAAGLLKPVYERTGGIDGYVSLEVAPTLAHDTEGTIAEARSLFDRVNRPNLMIKIPATPEGLPAITASIAASINVNVTLIFSREMYEKVMDAYLQGLDQRLAAGRDISHIASVASFFVSRLDTLVDGKLEALLESKSDPAEQERLRGLLGKVAVANTKLAYQLFKKTFSEERFGPLQAKGAHFQRPLWASTSTKNPAYHDLLYVETLIGPHTINTAPPKTIEALRDHGVVALTLEEGVDEAQAVMDKLAAEGIDMKQATDQLLAEGVKAFADAFRALLNAIEEKRQQFVAEMA